MYKIFEVIDSTSYYLCYETNDLEMASNMLMAFKTKYLDKKYVLLDLIK